MSSISASENSDHDHAEGSGDQESPGVFEEKPPEPPESPLIDVPDEADRLEENMPWLKVISKLVNSFNFYCTHQGFCHPNCFRRQMRAAKRLMEATREVRQRLCRD